MEVSREGDVNRLKVNNRSSRMVLIFDGEELVGANRTGLSIPLWIPSWSTSKGTDA